MLTLQLGPVFAARGIDHPIRFLIKAGFTRSIAAKLLRGTGPNIRFADIEKLCILLYCTPNDILGWSPGHSSLIPAGHPITVLQKQPGDYSWKESIKTIPLAEIHKLAGELRQKSTPDSAE